MRRRLVDWTLIVFACALLRTVPASADGEKAEWTVLVYEDADCDLEAPMLDDLDEMIAVGGSDSVKIVALVDRSPAAEPVGRYTNRAVGGLPDWSGGKLVEVEKGKLREIDSMKDEPNLGDPATLVSFVDRALKEFPAKHVALVLSDHGLSWPGVCADDSHEHDFLTIAELRAALEAISKTHGRLDVLGFDACLMATLETAQAFAPFARVMVASEELEPGSGWWYTPFLDGLEKHPTADDASVGATIADTFQASFSKQQGVAGPDAGKDITLSVVDLEKVGAVAGAAEALAEAAAGALASKGREEYLGLARARAAAEQYGRSADPKKSGSQMYDLFDLAERLAAAVPALAPLAKHTQDAVGAAVLHAVRGEARPDAHGLSIYWPRDAAGVGGLYDAAGLGARAQWARLLSAYAALAAKDTEKPEAGETTGSVPSPEADKPVTVTAAVASTEDLESTRFVLAEKRGDGVVIVGAVPAAPPVDGKLTGSFAGAWFTLEDGTQRVICPITSFDEADDAKKTFVVDVPAQVRAKGAPEWEDVTLTFFLDEEEGGSVRGEFLNATKFEDGGPTEIPLEPGDEVRALYVRVDASGATSTVAAEGEGTTLTVDAQTSLKVGFDKVPAGEWLVGFWLEDFSGNSSVTLAPVTVK